MSGTKRGKEALSIENRQAFLGKINVSFPWELPNNIHGPAVVFDVVAASHNIANLVSRADQLYVVTKDTVHYALHEIPDAVLVGESDDLTLREKFVASNSVSSIAQTDVKAKKVILITNNGTHTLAELWDKGARPLVVASYANLDSTVNWLLDKESNAESITLVPSGGREQIFASSPNLLEDLLCAKAAEDLLRGRVPNFEQDFLTAREFIDQHYPQSWPTKEEDLTLIFSSSEIYPVVPLCEKLPNGLLKVVTAPI